MSVRFLQPRTLNEALQYRRESDSAVLAGGTDLIVAMRKEECRQERSMVDLSKISELKEIRLEAGEIVVGAMATFANIAESELLCEKAEALVSAARTVGSPQIRNRGTIGGNICNASPAADSISPLVCLEATVSLVSMSAAGSIATRSMPIEDFITGNNKTLLEKGEIMHSVRFAVPQDGALSEFRKIGRRNSLAMARLNGACMLWLRGGKLSDVRLSIGSVMARPQRFTDVEEYLRGKTTAEGILADSGRLASTFVLARSGQRESSAYKLPVTERFVAALIEGCLKKSE